MCGIIAVVSNSPVKQRLLDGLKRLEYRGYDSAGIALINDGKIKLVRSKGKIAQLEKNLRLKSLDGQIGIAHTRWATHGRPSEQNAHPHLDCGRAIAVVHNGIIENYLELKELLESEGHIFRSQTDTEALVHLIEKFYRGDLEQAVLQALKLANGAFALAIIHRKESRIIAARRGSPLIIGVGTGEMFLASDVPAILPYTNKMIYLNDDEVADLRRDRYSVKKLNGQAAPNHIQEIKWSLTKIEKGGYKHFMLKEIFEQSQSLSNVLRGRLKEGKVKISVRLDRPKINRAVIVACGTSYHAGLVGKYILEGLADISTEVDYASEFRYRNPKIGATDLVIAISQSGETADTLAALRLAKKERAQTLGIVNAVGSTLAREVDSGIYLHAGPEIGVASTKAFTSQIIALILLAGDLLQGKGRLLPKRLVQELSRLSLKARKVLNLSQQIKKIALKYADSEDFLYLGRLINYPTALEGSLKLKEISYIHAEGYPSAEMKHGPIALVDRATPSLFVVPKDGVFQKNLSNIEEIKARGGQVIVLTDRKSKTMERAADDQIILPRTDELLFPVLAAVALQLFAYFIADAKGLDVDKPRNLAKSVTVE